MKNHTLLTLVLWLAMPLAVFGQTFSITEADHNHISLRFRFDDFSIDTVVREGEVMHTIATQGIVVPNEYGQPDLPTFNRFVAIPQGARAVVEVRASRDEQLSGINIAPSDGSQCENEAERPFMKDPGVYGRDMLYPTEAVRTAEPQSLRGVDVIHLGICPAQFNPVARTLSIHRQFDIDIRFEGGNGHFGDDRLRSPYWDPILRNNILNYESLEPIDYDARMQQWSTTRPTGCEYLIITPNNEAYVEAAQELADFRLRQGILTKVMTLAETGATTAGLLRMWFRDIYANWDIPPVAVCLIGESGDDLEQYVPGFRTQHPKDDFITSDNPYADINDDNLPDICFTRLIAQNESELPIFIGKQIEYEYTNPVNNLYYYAHPLTAAGWQDAKWFQIAIATVSGFLTQHGKIPTRINEIYSGEQGPQWSTAPGTASVVNYFGPNGVGYIPATPDELGGWTGGTAEQVINAINTGAYIIQHRDHGWNNRWYQPEIYITDFGDINNPGKMTYLVSVNCRTGMYDWPNDCFVERLIRMQRDGQNAGIVGAIAPAGQTYSYANDIFLWGVWDLFDSSFLPDYGPFADHADAWLPSFACVSGKYFLETHVFPSTNQEMCVCTYNTFHTHGDAFLRIFTNMPESIATTHDLTVAPYEPFHITAPEGSQIALSMRQGGEIHILATATGTGEEQTITIMQSVNANVVHLTITGLNLLRHEEDLIVAPHNQAFVVVDSIALNAGGLVLAYDQTAVADIKVANIGDVASESGSVTLSSISSHVGITQDEVQFEPLDPSESVVIENAFQFGLDGALADGSLLPITCTTHFGDESYARNYDIAIKAPRLVGELISIDDSEGNGDGLLDPGEVVRLFFRITNEGHYVAESPRIALRNNEGYVRVITPETTIDDLEMGGVAVVSFDVYVEYIAGESTHVHLLLIPTVGNLSSEQEIPCAVGFIIESFESGQLSPEYWTNDSEHPWVVGNAYAYDGYYSARSATIEHNESSQLTFTHDTRDGGFFSFYAMVSSESNYDFLVFSIDGEERERWSGEQWWGEHSYAVHPGHHTYTWTYLKDYSVNAGLDAAWIDYIVLPTNLDDVEEEGVATPGIHPNPTTGRVSVDLKAEDGFTIQVFDSDGKHILTESNKAEVSIEQQPAGLYHIIVEQDGHRWHHKIIKL